MDVHRFRRVFLAGWKLSSSSIISYTISYRVPQEARGTMRPVFGHAPFPPPIPRKGRWMNGFPLVMCLLAFLLVLAAAGVLTRPATGAGANGMGPSFPAPLVAPAFSWKALTQTPTVVPTPTPIPWDDILVTDAENPLCSNEALAVAGQDVYVVYYTGMEVGYLVHSTDGGKSFAPPVQLPSSGGRHALTRREGATPRDPTLYVAFDADRRILFTRSTDRGNTWSAATIVRDGTADDLWTFFPRVAVNSSGIIYVTWIETPTGSTVGYYYLARSLDGGQTWSTPSQVSPDAGSRSIVIQSSSLVARHGVLYFAWLHYPPGEVAHSLFTRSTDTGQSWTTPVRVDDGGEASKEEIDLAVSADGTIYTAWDDDRKVRGALRTYVARSTDMGSTWSPGKQVDDGGPGSWSSVSGAIAWDEATASLHVALQDGRNCLFCADTFYSYSTDRGTRWSCNEQISNPVGNMTGRHSMQAWRGIVYTTFIGGMPGGGPLGLWLDIHNPHLPPVMPTPTPTWTATPSPSCTATRTPSPSPSATWTRTPTASPAPTMTPTTELTGTPTPPLTPTMIQEWRLYLPHLDRNK